MGKVILERISGAAGFASCAFGEDASFGRRNSLGDGVCLGVPGDVLLGVLGDGVFLGVPGDVFLGVLGEDLSSTDLTRKLLGGRGEVGDLGERPFGAFLSFVASGEGVLAVCPFARVRPSFSLVSCASCLLGVVDSGDLAKPLLTARGVTMGEGDVTPRALVGVEGGG